MALPKPSSRHTTLADSRFQRSSQIVPHSLLLSTSTRPSPTFAPPFSRSRGCGKRGQGYGRHGMAQHGTARHGVVLNGTARHSTAQCGAEWHSTAQHGMLWHNMCTQIAGCGSCYVMGHDTVPTSCSRSWSPRDVHTHPQGQRGGRAPQGDRGSCRSQPGAHLALLLLALLLLVPVAGGKEGPGHAADDSWRAGCAGGRGIAAVELEGAHGEVNLRPHAGHRVQAVVELLPLHEEPARREEPEAQRTAGSAGANGHPARAALPVPAPRTVPGRDTRCRGMPIPRQLPAPCPGDTHSSGATERGSCHSGSAPSHLPLLEPYVLPVLLFRLRFVGQPGKQKTPVKELRASGCHLGRLQWHGEHSPPAFIVD